MRAGAHLRSTDMTGQAPNPSRKLPGYQRRRLENLSGEDALGRIRVETSGDTPEPE